MANNPKFEIELTSVKALIEHINELELSYVNLSNEEKESLRLRKLTLKKYGETSKEYKQASKELDGISNRLRENKKALDEQMKSLKVSEMNYNQLAKASKKLSAQLRNTSQAANPKEWGEMNSKLKEMRAQMRLLDGQAQEVKKSMSFKDSAKSLGATLGLVALAGAALQKGQEFIMESWEKSKQVQAEANKAAIVFGDNLGYVEAKASKLANTAGLTNREFVAMAASTADLLVPIGFTRKEAAEMSVELQTLTGALAEWSGGKLKASEVSERITKAMLGEVDGLKELGIAISLESKEYKDLYKSKLAVKGVTEEQSKALAIQELMLKKTTDAVTSYHEGSNKLLRLGNEISKMWRQATESVAYYFSTTKGQRLVDQSRELKAVNNDLKMQESRLKELIPSYDKLKSKSNLSINEQIELKNIIGEIINIAPNASSAFDEYGNAIAISTSKATDFMESQKNLSKFQNEKQIDEMTKRIKDNIDTIESAREDLSKKNYGLYMGIPVDDDGAKEVLNQKQNLLIEKIKDSTNEIYEMTSGLQVFDFSIDDIAEGAGVAASKIQGYYNEIDRKKNASSYNNDGSKKTAEQLAADKATKQKADKDTQAAANAAKAAKEQAKKQAEASDKAAKERIVLEAKQEKEIADTALKYNEDKQAQQVLSYEKRLTDLGLFNKAQSSLTEEEQKTLAVLEREHNRKIDTIMDERVASYLGKIKSTHKEELYTLALKQAEELANFKGTAKEKEKLLDTHNKKSTEITIKHASEMKSELTKLIGEGGMLDGMDFTFLSDEQKAELESQVKELHLLMAKAKAAGNVTAPDTPDKDYSFGNINKSDSAGVDILGFSGQDWEILFKNLEDGELGVNELYMAFQTMSNMYGAYSNMKKAMEDKELKSLEKSSDEKKDILKEQLDSNLITQDDYYAKVENIDSELEQKRAEVEYNQAKRDKAQALINAAINTAVSVTKVIDKPALAIAVGVAGAIQIGLIAAQPLPEMPGKEDGGYVMRNDGKVFKAENDYARRGYIRQPTVLMGSGGPYLTGENGTEYVVPAEGLRNPDIARFIHSIEQVRINGTIRSANMLSGFEKGGYAQPATVVSPPASSSFEGEIATTLRALTSTLEKLQKDGVEARMDPFAKGGMIEGMDRLYRIRDKSRIQKSGKQ